MAKLMIPYGHPEDPAAFEDQADGDKPISDSPPPFGRARTGQSCDMRSHAVSEYVEGGQRMLVT
jgi:hypothetical protein